MLCECEGEQVRGGLRMKVVNVWVDVEVRFIGCVVACGQWVDCGLDEL